VLPLSAEEIDGDGDVEDLGEIPFIADDGVPSPQPVPGRPEYPGAGAATPVPDEPPAHARRGWRNPPRAPSSPSSGGKRTTRVTASIRQDITAKIALPLEIGGRIWQARDPLCGGTFVDCRPDIAEAVADIVCDSADLVAFFTGPGGAFMKYLNLGAALWPVAEMVAAHHVYHTVELAEGEAGPVQQHGQYAA
jgi:hypothetical protein